MKIIDSTGHINNKVIKLEIHEKAEYLKSIIENTDLDEYTKYRLEKGLERIKNYNKKIK